MSRNSSTSSSDSAWRRFCLLVLAGALVPAAVLYLLVLIIDPYDSIAFSPRWDRYPVRGDHRHWNAKLLKEPEFDSMVIGTSSSMLLKPTELNHAFGGAFVNLSMPAASPFEQLRILSLFRHYHPRTVSVVVGLDTLWCHPDGGRKFTTEVLQKAFPKWLYDTNPWNDVPPFNKTTLKAAYDQVRALLGTHRPYQRWMDGYEDLTKTLHEENSPDAVRQRIYEGPQSGVLWRKPEHPHELTYPDLDRLGDALAGLPAGTLKVLFFSPYHYVHQARPGTEQDTLWGGCKAKAAALGGRVENLVVVDFLLRSPITKNDDYYIDGYHYRKVIASRLVEMLRSAVYDPQTRSEAFRLLARSRHGLEAFPASR